MSLLDSLSILGKIVLIISSVLSFSPQLHRLQKHGESTGISLFYVLFNLIVATEQLTVGIFLVAFGFGSPGMLHWPPLFGEWLNLVQFGAVWLCHLVLLLYCLHLLPSSRGGEKFVVVVLYGIFFAMSLGAAVILLVVTIASSPRRDTGWLPVLLAAAHVWFINPVIIVAGIFSLLAQACQMGPSMSRSALSIDGLLAQAIIFGIIGISWAFRLMSPWEFNDWEHPWSNLNRWFELVGWAVLDNLIFAFVQAALFCIVRRRRDGTATADETTSLLAHG